ncbi:hypothetical protein HDU83_004061 [Entophlyctis luteolus]|nr:hypothetical protein HDU83_004061 [Entophlyctis luteolus]
MSAASAAADAPPGVFSPTCAQGGIPQKHFHNLPVEIQLAVFSLVCRDCDDCLDALMCLGRVCKHWKRLSDSAALVTRISAGNYASCRHGSIPTRSLSATVRILAKRARGCLRVLDLSSPREGLAPIAIKEVSLFCPNITHMSLSGCAFLRSFQLVFMVRHLVCLTYVNVSGLKCVNSIALEVLARPGRLQALDISHCAQLRDSAGRGLGAILDNCLNLTALYAGYTGAMDDELMAKVWHLPVLAHLDVAGSEKVSTAGLLSALLGPLSSSHVQSIPKLERVRTDVVPAHYYFMPTTDADVSERPHVLSLNFASCGSAVTSSVLTALAWTTPNLAALNISNSFRLTDDIGLVHITRACTHLVSLQMDNCSGLLERMQPLVRPPVRLIPTCALTGRYSHGRHSNNDESENDDDNDGDEEGTNGNNINPKCKVSNRNGGINIRKRKHDEHRRQHSLGTPSNGLTFTWLTHLYAAACTPHLTNARAFALLEACAALRVVVLDDNAPALCARLVVLWLLMRSGGVGSSVGGSVSVAAAPHLSLLSLRGCGYVDAPAVDALVAARRPDRFVGRTGRNSFSRGSSRSSGTDSGNNRRLTPWTAYDRVNVARHAKVNDANDDDIRRTDGDSDGVLEVLTDTAAMAAAGTGAGEAGSDCIVM